MLLCNLKQNAPFLEFIRIYIVHYTTYHLHLQEKEQYFFFDFQQMSILPLIFFITLGWSIDKPCISHTNCSCVSFLTSSSFFGQLNFPVSRRLYIRRNPSPSHKSAFSLSFLLPQNKNKLSVNRSSRHFCSTIAARPSIDFLMSV